MNKLSFYYILSILFFFISLFFTPQGLDFFVIYVCLFNYYFIFLMALKKPIFIYKYTFFKIDVFFLIFYYIIYFSMYQGYVLGLNGLNTVWLSGYEEYGNISLIVSSIGMNCFCFGINNKNRFTSRIFVKPFFLNNKPFVSLSWFLFFVNLLLIILYFRTGLSYLLAGRYLGSNVGDTNTDGLYFLITVFVLISLSFILFYLFHFKTFLFPNLLLLFISLIWFVVLLISGDRNSMLLILLLVFGAYYSFFSSISRKQIILYFFVGLFFYQIIEISRRLEDRSFSQISTVISDRLVSSESNDKSFFSDQNSFFTTTVGYRGTFYLVPKKENYFFGKFQFVGVIGIIPYFKGFVLNNNDFSTTSEFLTYYLKGRFSPMGIGTNVISDLYIDFGILGVIIFMFLLGKFSYFVENKIKISYNSILWFSLYFITLCTISEISRYTFLFPLRSCVWSILILSSFQYIFKNRLNLDIK